MSILPLAVAQDDAARRNLDTLYDMVMNGGPVMWPIALCSVIAVAYIVERSLRLRRGRLGSPRFRRELLAAVESGGAAAGLALCEKRDNAMARVLAAGLRRDGAPPIEVEKAVEDAGAREVRRLAANLKPLVVVTMLAPLLGLLGTVWGMIEAFAEIATQSGLGKPELLASGITHALVTTAAGLSVAIPTQAAYFVLRGRIDRFVRATEDTFDALFERRRARPAPPAGAALEAAHAHP